MNLTLALFLVLLQPAELGPMDKPLTWECKAMAAPKVVAELANLTQLDLKCDPALVDEILLVRVQDVPLSTVLEKIEASTGGKWDKRRETWTLLPKPQPSEAELYAERLKKIQDAQAGLFVKIADYGTEEDTRKEAKEAEALTAQYLENPRLITGSEYQKMSQAAFRNPTFIFSHDVFRRLDAKALASIRGGERVVFATKPNSRQQPIADPVEFKKAVQLFADRAKIWAEYEGKALAAKQNGSPQENIGRKFGSLLAASPELLVSISRADSGTENGTYQIEVRPPDGLLNTTLTFSVSLEGHNPEVFSKLEEFSASLPKVGRAGENLTLSPDAFLVLKSSLPGREVDSKSTQAAFSLLKNPMEKDILSYGASETLLAMLKSERANAVLNIPDDWVGLPGYATLQTEGVVPLTSIQGNIAALAYKTGVMLRFENGWATMAPTQAMNSISPAQRVSRRLLQQVMDEGSKAVPDPIRVRCLLQVLNASEDPTSQFLFPYYQALGQGIADIHFDRDVSLARFILSLSTAEYAGLKSGKPVQYGSLSKTSQKLFDSMVFGHGGNVEKVPDIEDVTSDLFFDRPFPRFNSALEPTVAVEHGVRPETEIRFEQVSKLALRAYLASKSEEDAMNETIESLVRDELMSEELGVEFEGEEKPEFYRLLEGGSTYLSAELVPGQVRVHRFLVSVEMKPVGAFMRKNELPANILKLWTETKIREREAMDDTLPPVRSRMKAR